MGRMTARFDADPEVDELPTLTSESRTAVRILMGIGLALTAFGGVVAWRVGSFSKPIGVSGLPFGVELGGIISLVVGPMLVVFAFVGRAMARWEEQDLAAFGRGEFLVHWTLSPDELRAFTGDLTKRAYGFANVGLVGLVVVSAALAVAGALGPFGAGDRLGYGAMEFGSCVAGSVGLYLLARWCIRGFYRDRERRGRHAFVGEGACYYAGQHACWNVQKRFLTVRLEGAEVNEKGGIGVLTLTISTRAGSAKQDAAARAVVALVGLFAAMSGHGAHGHPQGTPKVIRVPIPRGHEDEARDLARRLRATRTR
jgi:hypothetical protein